MAAGSGTRTRASGATSRKKKDPDSEPLMVKIGDESFALTAIQEIEGDNGEKFKVPVPSFEWLEQLSFGEQLEVRKIARDLSGNPQGEPGDFAPMDVVPALVTVVNKRSNDKFTLDDALALDWDEVSGRPTKAAPSAS